MDRCTYWIHSRAELDKSTNLDISGPNCHVIAGSGSFKSYMDSQNSSGQGPQYSGQGPQFGGQTSQQFGGQGGGQYGGHYGQNMGEYRGGRGGGLVAPPPLPSSPYPGPPAGSGREYGGGGYGGRSAWEGELPLPAAARGGGARDVGGWGGEPRGGCVLVVHGLPTEFNCDRLFNLLCLYGNVSKVFFMKTKTGAAMVEMGDWEAAERVCSHLKTVELFGARIQMDVSRKHSKITNAPLEFTLADGSSSVKDYFLSNRLNRLDFCYLVNLLLIPCPSLVAL